MKRLGLALVVALGVAHGAEDKTEAERKLRLAQIDLNGDGRLDANEVDLGLLNQMKGGTIDFTLPLSAEAMPRVLAAMSPPDQTQFRLSRSNFRATHGAKSYYGFQDVDPEADFSLPKPKPPASAAVVDEVPTRFYMRRSLEKMPPGQTLADPVVDELSKAADKLGTGGAWFSYGRANSGASELIVEGLFSFELSETEVHRAEAGKGSNWTAYNRVILSAGFNRIDFKGDGLPKTASPQFKAESNFLQFALTKEFALPGPHGAGFTGSVLRVSELATTDWSFDSQIYTTEAEWSPFNGPWGLNRYAENSVLGWRLLAAMHLDYGWVRADGKWTKSQAGEEFAHYGEKLALKLFPFPQSQWMLDRPVTFELSFLQYEKWNKESKLIRNLSGTASWYLLKPGKGVFNPGLALSLTYQNLKNVENKTDDDTWFLGVAVGY